MGELAAKDRVAMNGGLVHQEFPQDDRGPLTAVCNSSLQIACLWGVCCITSPELSLGLGQTANEVLLTSRISGSQVTAYVVVGRALCQYEVMHRCDSAQIDVALIKWYFMISHSAMQPECRACTP